MKGITKFILFGFLVCLLGCDQEDFCREVSDCIQNELENFTEESCEGANVKEYTFQGSKVYVFNGKCGDDFQMPVLDEECRLLGFLGGFSGNSEINGEPFSNAVLVGVVWEK